jgi:diguanylate cyclase (GGDEF)-like protein
LKTGLKSFDMTQTATIEELAINYLENTAPVMFLVLNKEGEILSSSAYADSITGKSLRGLSVSEIIYDHINLFSPSQFQSAAGKERILNIITNSGLAKSLYCRLVQIDDRFIILGRLNIEEVENTSMEVLSLNNELNTLTRQLHMKNRELERANEKILQLTRTDPLTGLANRRFFNERIDELISLSKRKMQPLSLIMTDIDKFKTVNDLFGHDIGDKVLKGYAGLMKSKTRPEDLVARFGGEEFIILLPLSDEHQAFSCAEHIRQALAGIDLAGNGHLVTASFGISRYRQDESVAQLVKRADTALYKAKQGGRNRTIVAAEN